MNDTKDTLIVQIMDAEGFWCNVGPDYQHDQLKLAKSVITHAYAQSVARVVKGPKRRVLYEHVGENF